jgi:hypothetical protein
MLTTRSNSKNNEDTNKIIPIVCGVVIDGNEKKNSHLTSEDFLKKREEDMHLMANFKYGVRVKNDTVIKLYH